MIYLQLSFPVTLTYLAKKHSKGTMLYRKLLKIGRPKITVVVLKWKTSSYSRNNASKRRRLNGNSVNRDQTAP